MNIRRDNTCEREREREKKSERLVIQKQSHGKHKAKTLKSNNVEDKTSSHDHHQNH